MGVRCDYCISLEIGLLRVTWGHLGDDWADLGCLWNCLWGGGGGFKSSSGMHQLGSHRGCHLKASHGVLPGGGCCSQEGVVWGIAWGVAWGAAWGCSQGCCLGVLPGVSPFVPLGVASLLATLLDSCITVHVHVQQQL